MKHTASRLLLAHLVVVVGFGGGCEVIEEILRAGVTGTVQVPEVAGAATRAPLDPESKRLRDAVAAAVRTHQPARDPRTRRRALKPGRDAHVAPRKELVEKWRPGEVIVRAHEPIRGRKAEISRALTAAFNDEILVDVRLCGTEYRCLADLTTRDGKRLDLEQTREAVAWLARHPLLKYAEKNLILEKTSVFPSDEYFTFQWHYAAIDVPAAWDITVGDPDVVAAVIDTGILFDHPDLQGRVIGGVDLIDDPDVANDGDGRDDDGDDAGDSSCGVNCHSHHGSHVAGTIGAATDNGEMVSGITWAGGLLAVRALGEGGGTLFDIADGIEWAIGNEVDGVTRNPRPADVLNMSLGGVGESQAMNEAIADAVATGAIVVVAAGNDDADASGFTPANAPDAITIAAVGNGAGDTPAKASYSNFGDKVDVAAPGGEQIEDNDEDGNGDGVLSTVADFVAFSQGTSMATPHVAGVAMLMKSVNRAIDQEQVRQILRDTADPVVCDAGCGAGQINAFAAVTAAQGGQVEGLTATGVRVGRGVTTATIVFKNRGDTAIGAVFSVGGADRDAVSIAPTSASIPGHGRVSVIATIARNETVDDVGSALITAAGGGFEAEARLDWTSDRGGAGTTVSIGAVLIEGGELEVVATTTTNELQGFRYSLGNLDPGTYRIVGLLDGNNDNDFDDPEDGTGFFVAPAAEGEACSGAGCGNIELVLGEIYEGADFLVAPGFSGGDDVGGDGDGALGDACASNGDCGDGLYCETGAGFTGGYCTTDCVDVDACPEGSSCFVLEDDAQICFKDCTVDADCGRNGYVCDFVAGIGSCVAQ